MRVKAWKAKVRVPRVGDVWETVSRGRHERVVVYEAPHVHENRFAGPDVVRLRVCNASLHGGRPMRSAPSLKHFLARYKLVSAVPE